ncbi:enoyl-CoA hydratase [Alsobacter sp. R-9]
MTPSSTGRIRIERACRVGVLAIDNPARRNAIDLAMWQALPALARDLDEDDAVRVIVLRGAGDLAFAAGADISEFSTVRASAEGGRTYEAANLAAFDAVARIRKPVVAMIRGFCLGGGLGLALACDLRVASDDAVFAIPAGRLGVGYPPAALAYAVAAVGAMRAKELFFTARRIDAAEAERIGLLTKRVAVADLERETMALAETIAANAPLTLRAAKAGIDAAAHLPGSPSAESLQALAAACFDSDDYREGRTAFLEKRAPTFTGR